MDEPIEITTEAGPLAWLIDSREPEAHLELLGRPAFIVPVMGAESLRLLAIHLDAFSASDSWPLAPRLMSNRTS